MSFDTVGPGGLDYFKCRYPGSKLLFRGPQRELRQPFVAFLGGTNTYGKFIEHPFPDLVEDQLDVTCANFGSLNAGVDTFLNDSFLQDATREAQVTVIQISSPRNMSNRYYGVHPRRNDRFLKQSTLLEALYQEVDFSQFNFTKHLMQTLRDVSPQRFQSVVDELQQAWRARMHVLLSKIPGETVLLWMSDHAPRDVEEDLDRDPWFVTRELLNEVRPYATEYVEVVASQDALDAGTHGMIYTEFEKPAAQHVLGPLVHHEAADKLAPVIARLMQ